MIFLFSDRLVIMKKRDGMMEGNVDEDNSAEVKKCWITLLDPTLQELMLETQSCFFLILLESCESITISTVIFFCSILNLFYFILLQK